MGVSVRVPGARGRVRSTGQRMRQYTGRRILASCLLEASRGCAFSLLRFVFFPPFFFLPSLCLAWLGLAWLDFMCFISIFFNPDSSPDQKQKQTSGTALNVQ